MSRVWEKTASKSAIVFLLSLCVVSLFFLKSWDRQLAIKQTSLATIYDLQTTHTQIKMEILEVYRTTRHYDPLTLESIRLQQQLSALNQTLSAIDYQPLLIEVWQPLQLTAEVYQKQVETFKSTNSILFNSLEYFSQEAKSILATDATLSQDLELSIQDLSQQLFLYGMKSSDTNQTQSNQLMTQIRQSLDGLEESTAASLELLLQHARFILQLENQLKNQVTQLERSPLQAELKRLETSFQQYWQQEQVITERYRFVLYGLGIAYILISYGAYLARLKQNNQRLQEARLTLEQQVAKRTQKLQKTLDELHRSQTQLVQSEKMSSLGQMVAGVAHEINNPVNFIHGNLRHLSDYTRDLISFLKLYEIQYPDPNPQIQAQAEALEIDFIQEDLEKILSSMRMGTERIREIVLSLRNFSRLDEAQAKTVDIHEGLESALMILQHRLKAGPECLNIEVVRDFDQLPLVECYAGQLNQVFMNILANAIDALEAETKNNLSDQKIPQIKIRTQTCSENVIISIADNGTGISPEVKNRIFDPFFTTKEVGKGTGMGMAISYQLITDKHNGKIECFSDEGVGTEFIIKLPIRLSSSDKQLQNPEIATV